MEAEGDAQESQFIALKNEEVIIGKHFYFNVLFDSVKYREATAECTNEQIKY